MARTIRFPLILLVAVGLLLGLEADLSPIKAEQKSANLPRVVHMAVSWAEGYGSISDLKRASDLVVAGTALGGGTVSTSGNLMFTDSPVAVDSVLWNRTGQPVASTVLVHQTGGTSGGVRLQLDEDPLYVPGERLILFLARYSADAAQYVTLNPEGRFEVADGKVRPGSSLHLPGFEQPVAEDAFLQQIRAASPRG